MRRTIFNSGLSAIVLAILVLLSWELAGLVYHIVLENPGFWLAIITATAVFIGALVMQVWGLVLLVLMVHDFISWLKLRFR